MAKTVETTRERLVQRILEMAPVLLPREAESIASELLLISLDVVDSTPCTFVNGMYTTEKNIGVAEVRKRIRERLLN